MAINLYETRMMLQAIERSLPAQTFLRDTFFPSIQTFVTEKVDVDIKKGKRKMAPFVARRRGGITIDRGGFSTETYTTPYIAPQRAITVDDIMNRGLGENIYSTRTPQERAQELLAKDIAELDEMITRREEWMCRELLLNGVVTIKGWVDRVDGGADYVEDVINFQFTNKKTLTGNEVWGGTSGGTPGGTSDDKIGDLKRIRLEIIRKTGKNPNIIIMANNVVDLFLSDEDVRSLFDIRNITLGSIQPRIQMDGVTYVGTLNALGLEIYTYDEWFLDDDGTEKPMIPDDHLIMASTGLGSRLYGAVTQMEEADGQFHTYEGTRVPRVWSDINNDVKMIRLASRPLPKPEDVDSWYVLKVKSG